MCNVILFLLSAAGVEADIVVLARADAICEEALEVVSHGLERRTQGSEAAHVDIVAQLAVRGQVVSADTSKPLEGVIVSHVRELLGGTVIAYSDDDGRFEAQYQSAFIGVDLEEGEPIPPEDRPIISRLVFEKSGYEPKRIEVEHVSGMTMVDLGEIALVHCPTCVPHVILREKEALAQGPVPVEEGRFGATVFAVAFSPDGSHVLTGSWRSAQLWDFESGELRQVFPGQSRVSAVAIAPDGTRALTGSDNGTVRLWDISTGHALHTFRGNPDPVWAVAFSPDGARILAGWKDSAIQVWDNVTKQPLHTYVGHQYHPVQSMAFSPHGDRMVSNVDITVILWDTNRQDPIRSRHVSSESVAYSPDGRRVLVGLQNLTAELWDAEMFETLVTYEGHEDLVFDVAFSPDGSRVLTGSGDGTARLWDTDSGRLRVVYEGHEDAVQAVAFSPDGEHIVTGSSDGTARVWETDSGLHVRTFRLRFL